MPPAPDFGFGKDTPIRVDFHLTDADQKLLCFFFGEYLRFPLEQEPQAEGLSVRRKRAMIRGGWMPQTRAHGDLVRRIAAGQNPWQLPLNAELNGQLRTLELLITYGMLRPEGVEPHLAWIQGRISEDKLENAMAASRYTDDLLGQAVLRGWSLEQVTALKECLEKTIEHVLMNRNWPKTDEVTGLPDLSGSTVQEIHESATHGANQLPTVERLEPGHLKVVGHLVLGWLGGADPDKVPA